MIKLTLSLLFMLPLFSSVTLAQTPVSNEQAQKYYESCATNRDERMSVATQDAFCQCSARGFKKHITIEDLTTLSTETGQAARDITNKMLINLYAPCMEHPVRDLVMNKCKQDAFQAGHKICECMASKMANYMSTRAGSELDAILKKTPDVYDPLGAITSSKSYEAQEKRTILQCIQGK